MFEQQQAGSLGNALARFSSGLLFKMVAGDGAPGATFSRASIATYVDATGLVKTAASNQLRDGHYIAGVRCVLLEGSRVNSCIQCRDLTQAAWVASTCTVAKDQTGADGTATSASSLTATGANATVLQAITLGSAAAFQSAYVKRITGVGTIQMTMDNGATWTTITITSAMARYTIPTQTLANPTVGFRIVTSGDAIAVDFVQNENGAFMTSVIPTTTVAVTRQGDNLLFPYLPLPQPLTVYVKYVEIGVQPISNLELVHVSNAANANPQLRVIIGGGTYRIAHHNGTTQVTGNVTGTPAVGDTVELRSVLFADGSVQIFQSLNGAAETTVSQSVANAIAAAWSGSQLYLGSFNGANPAYAAVSAVKFAKGAPVLADLRAA